MPSIDLNADLGEGDGDHGRVGDAALLAVTTTAHIACGFHAGSPQVMRRTVAAALEAGVVIGAHPSYRDPGGFGRRPLDVPAARVAGDVRYQLRSLDGVARSVGATVHSVKPHGALYHRIAEDAQCALAVASAVADFDPTIPLVLRAGSSTLEVVRSAGVRVVREGFCDRGYGPDGALASRGAPGALVTDPRRAAQRALAMVLEHRVDTLGGEWLDLEIDTLCVHGDTPGAVAIGRAVRAALEGAGVQVAAGAGG